MGRRQVREKILQTLYQLDLNPEPAEKVIERVKKSLPEDERAFFGRVVGGVLSRMDRLDAVLGDFLKKGWSLYRLAIVDRAVLRMALYELMFEEEIPPGVTLNEAVELAKAYSTEESGKFVNGVLGAIVERQEEIRERLTKEELE
ncbi:N utilization substance protein B [Polycladomyces abyssicola]|jgi:N utilization substance protein B|uniref:Transcription antitermination protein NusB n=1 Tax=Polycladomyces abyssicola TaxID=1125966 RepID=A0A8D5UGL1_9BACL|nr:transcription antitermination factor NusB [Polycladomyces abyssicola]BCU81592.1 N utilization substance protein B [Polycladomyces abyssicola]